MERPSASLVKPALIAALLIPGCGRSVFFDGPAERTSAPTAQDVEVASEPEREPPATGPTCGPRLVADLMSPHTPTVAGDRVYWLTADRQVWSVDGCGGFARLEASDACCLTSVGGRPAWVQGQTLMVSGESTSLSAAVRSIVVDDDEVFWTNKRDDVLRATRRNGAAVRMLTDAPRGRVFAADAAHVYFETTSQAGERTVRRIGRAADGASELVARSGAFDEWFATEGIIFARRVECRTDRCERLVLDPAQHISRVVRLDPVSGAERELARVEGVLITDVTIGHGSVYWSTTDSIWRRPLVGGAAAPVASTAPGSLSLALGRDAVYWANTHSTDDVIGPIGTISRLRVGAED